MSTETLTDVEYKLPYEEVSVETDTLQADFPCENKLGFTALCASCFLVNLYGDCPKNIREKAASEQNEATDNQQAPSFTLESALAPSHLESAAQADKEPIAIAPVYEAPKVKPVVSEVIRQEPSLVEEVVTTPAPEQAPSRSYRDLLFDDTVEVVVAYPKPNRKKALVESAPVAVLQEETIPELVYTPPIVTPEKKPVEAEVSTEPTAIVEEYVQSTHIPEAEPVIEPVVFVEEEIVEKVVDSVIDEPTRTVEPTSLQYPYEPALPLKKERSPVISSPVVTDPFIATKPDSATDTFSPILAVGEETVITHNIVAEPVVMDEPELQVEQPQEPHLTQQEPLLIETEDEYNSEHGVNDNKTNFGNDTNDTKDDPVPPNTPERLFPTIQKYSGMTFRYGRSFIGVFALLTLVLVDR